MVYVGKRGMKKWCRSDGKVNWKQVESRKSEHANKALQFWAPNLYLYHHNPIDLMKHKLRSEIMMGWNNFNMFELARAQQQQQKQIKKYIIAIKLYGMG